MAAVPVAVAGAALFKRRVPASQPRDRPRRDGDDQSLRCEPRRGSGLSLAGTLGDGRRTNPSGPQRFGAVAAGGGTVCRPFRFRASGACGTDARRHSRSRRRDRPGTVTFEMPLGAAVAPLAQNFDGVAAPSLPAGWTAANGSGASLWKTTTTDPDTLPNAAFVDDPARASDKRLRDPPSRCDRRGATGLPAALRDRRVLRRRSARGLLAQHQRGSFHRRDERGGRRQLRRRRIFGAARDWNRKPARRPRGLDRRQLRLLHDGREPRPERRGPDDPPALAPGHRQQRRRPGWWVDSIAVSDGVSCCVLPEFIAQPMEVDEHSAAGTASDANGVSSQARAFSWRRPGRTPAPRQPR